MDYNREATVMQKRIKRAFSRNLTINKAIVQSWLKDRSPDCTEHDQNQVIVVLKKRKLAGDIKFD